jgi:Zn-dependent protease with chaperone function
MTFLIVFLGVIFASILLPYILRLIFKTERVTISKVSVFVGLTPFSYAFTAGCFGTETIFVNANFSRLLNDAQKEALVMHEVAHVRYSHVTMITLLAALKYAIIAQILVYFASWYILLLIAAVYVVINSGFAKFMRPIKHAHEFKADRYAALKTGYNVTIVDLYYQFALQRRSNSHPSITDRLNNLSEINLTNEKTNR